MGRRTRSRTSKAPQRPSSHPGKLQPMSPRAHESRTRALARPRTKLQRELAAEPGPRRPTPLDAFLLARKKFLAAERIDMSGLAEEVGVNRVTLYRWVGSRDQLLVEVLWSLTSRTLEKVERRVRARGGDRIVQVVTRFLDDVITNAGMRRWLSEEG